MESLTASLSTGSNVLNAFNSALIDLKMQYTESDYIIIELQEIVDCIASNVNAEAAIHFLEKEVELKIYRHLQMYLRSVIDAVAI